LFFEPIILLNELLFNYNLQSYVMLSLVGSMMVDAEFDRDDYGSIPRNCDQKGAGTT
jgi:hypothetical protein